MTTNIHFKEVIYCSSQQSIVTGMAGFQVRTHSEAIESQIIDALSNNNIYGYSLSSERQVSLSQLQENPSIVTEYPQNFVFKKILIGGEVTKYVFARTVYIGIDYGYFCGLENLRRAGSNYLTHVLVFDQEPPQEVFALLLHNNYFGNNVFLPLDYNCLPNNPELSSLLTGAPQYLPSNSFQITGQSVNIKLADYTADLIIGIAQLYISRMLGESNKHLIVKVSNNVTNYLVWVMKSFLPSKLTSSLTFQTNYYRDGVPDDVDVVFVNEHYSGTLYESDHICVDYFTNQHIGIENNYLYDQIRQLISSQNNEEAIGLLVYLCEINISTNNDYRFLYNLYMIYKSHQEITTNELSFDFLQKLTKANLSGDNKSRVWDKINSAINKWFSSNETEHIKAALSICCDILKLDISKEYNITKSSTASFTKYIFDVPYNFADIVNVDNYKTILNFTDKEIISDRLFTALNTVTNHEIWLAYIKHYLNSDGIVQQSSMVLERVAQSNLSEQSLTMLIESLYSIQKSLVFNFLNSSPEYMCRFKSLLLTWSNSISLQQLSGITYAAQQDTAIYDTLNTLINQLFISKISNTNDTGEAFGEFIDFVKFIGVTTANSIGVSTVVDRIAEEIEKSPMDSYQSLIQEMLALKIKISHNAANIFGSVLRILSNEVPQHFDLQTMIMAYQLKKDRALEDMFVIWVKQGISRKELKEFIVQTDGLYMLQPFIGKLLLVLWNSSVPDVKSKRIKYIEVVIDNCKWDKRVKSEFLKETDDSLLISHITKSSSFINKLLRKL